MKKQYVRPMMVGEKFLANEYCSVECGKNNVVYNFVCDAGSKWSDYNVYFDNGTPYATMWGDDVCDVDYTGYSPCGTTHQASSNSGFEDGYMYKQGDRGQDSGQKIDVIIWTENNTNVHCTTNLDMDSWTTAKS